MSRPSTTTNLYPPSIAAAAQAALNSRTLTLWIHDPDSISSLSRNETVLNYELFPKGVAKPGDVAEVRLVPAITPPSGVNISAEGYTGAGPPGAGHTSENGTTLPATDRRPSGRKESYTGSVTGDEDSKSNNPGNPPAKERKFLFVIRELNETQKKLNVQVLKLRCVSWELVRELIHDAPRFRWRVTSPHCSVSRPDLQFT